MRSESRRNVATAATLSCLLLAGAWSPAAAQGAGTDGVREELLRLNGSMDRLVALVEAWTAESGRTERIRQVDELDRTIAFLDQELRERRAERDELEVRLEGVLRAMDQAERRLQGGGEPSVFDMLAEEPDPARRLEGQERQLYRLQESLNATDARIQELRDTLAERRAMRERLAVSLQDELAGRSR
ncbi:MAG: hypothetical protein PVF68_05960 [Acidobacteriota bacterium]|jgi:chromosome segregation ATPase